MYTWLTNEHRGDGMKCEICDELFEVEDLEQCDVSAQWLCLTCSGQFRCEFCDRVVTNDPWGLELAAHKGCREYSREDTDEMRGR